MSDEIIFIVFLENEVIIGFILLYNYIKIKNEFLIIFLFWNKLVEIILFVCIGIILKIGVSLNEC